MKRHDVKEILTADTAFDRIEQVRRIDPARFPPER
jgi:predicted nucleic acid-binding protein